MKPPKFFIPARMLHSTAELKERVTLKSAKLIFGEEAIAGLPTYSKGAHAGKPKGYIHTRYASHGGWCAEAGRALKDGEAAEVWITELYLGRPDAALWGLWLGILQPLHSPDGRYIREAGRALWAAEQAELAAGKAA